jgi:hypothetical protein
MMIALHKNARATPARRAERAASSQTTATLALRYCVSEDSVYKWKSSNSFNDASHTPHRLQTSLTPAQEQIVVELRKMLLLPLDDLLAVTREFRCPQAKRPGLDRCMRHHGIGNLNAQGYVSKLDQRTPVARQIRAIFNTSDAHEEQRLLGVVLKEWRVSHSQLAAWAKINLPEGFAVFGQQADQTLILFGIDQPWPRHIESSQAWLHSKLIRVLNVAGPSEERHPGIYAATLKVLDQLFS